MHDGTEIYIGEVIIFRKTTAERVKSKREGALYRDAHIKTRKERHLQRQSTVKAEERLSNQLSSEPAKTSACILYV